MSATPDGVHEEPPPASTDMALKMTVLPPRESDSVPPFTVKTGQFFTHTLPLRETVPSTCRRCRCTW